MVVSMKNKEKKIDSIKYLLKIFLITRIVLVIFMVFFNFLLSNDISGQYNGVFSLFDNEHYLNIAINGYMYEYQYAFFPLTPLLIRYLGKLGFLFLNQICVLLSGYLLYLISDKIFKNDKPCSASVLFFISPISIFTCMFYSEALFIFLTILAFYLYKSKKNYFVLGLTLGLSVMTRSFGSMLFFTIFIFMFIDLIRKREKFKNILITYIPATIISCLYPIFLYVKTGNFLYFMDTQFIYWGRISTNIFTILFDAFKIILNKVHFLFIFDYILVFFLIGYVIYVIIKNIKEKKYYEIFLYIILSFIIMCSTIRGGKNPLASFYRYIFGCFPIYFMIKKNDFILMLIIFFSCFITFIFLMGIHFY